MVGRLHVGCGEYRLEGWLNVDVRPSPAVDEVWDVRFGLKWTSLEFIFAEHFIEHLSPSEGLEFLRACRRALMTGGVLRLSTPNLDWVWLTHYRNPEELEAEEALIGCLEMNRAFRGWGHQFIYNSAMLERALRAAGFGRVTFCKYGESEIEELRGLERHERAVDHAKAQHVVIAEAIADGVASNNGLPPILEEYLRDFSIS